MVLTRRRRISEIAEEQQKAKLKAEKKAAKSKATTSPVKKKGLITKKAQSPVIARKQTKVKNTPPKKQGKNTKKEKEKAVSSSMKRSKSLDNVTAPDKESQSSVTRTKSLDENKGSSQPISDNHFICSVSGCGAERSEKCLICKKNMCEKHIVHHDICVPWDQQQPEQTQTPTVSSSKKLPKTTSTESKKRKQLTIFECPATDKDPYEDVNKVPYPGRYKRSRKPTSKFGDYD